MENKSLTNPSRRRRNNRSGGGNRNQGGGNSRNRNRNRNRNGNRSGGGNRSRNRSNNGNRGGNRSRSRRRSAPKQTRAQKILSVLTFGLLGKPKPKSKKTGQQNNQPKPTERQKMRAAQAESSNTPKEKKKRNRSEVTSGRLYVGNLSYDTTELELEELFRGVGNVLSAEVVTNSRTQQSKGFAFVEMVSLDAAKRAVEILDDQEFMGRKLVVTGARSDGPRDEEADSSDSSDTADAELETVGEDRA